MPFIGVIGAIMCETARLPTALRMVSFTAARGAIIEKQAPQWSLLGLGEASCCCSLWSSSQTLPAESSPSSGRTEHIYGNIAMYFKQLRLYCSGWSTLQRHNTGNSKQIFPGKELRGYSPNSYIHVFVRDLFILLQENM
jgi:hypothetical protein